MLSARARFRDTLMRIAMQNFFADMISKISRGVVPPAVRQLVPEIRSSKAIVSPIREVAESIAIPQIIIGEIPSWHL